MNKQEFVPGEKKNITVYGTRGEQQAKFETKGDTWEELKAELKKNSINPEGMKAIIGETQEELKENDQVIKEKEISLFLSPIKVSSGN